MKNTLWLVISIFTFFIATSCSHKTQKKTAVVNYQLENALLWEITGNGLKETSYLYGTIHLIGEDDFFLTDSTKITFNQTQQLALEIDLDEMTNPFKMLGMISGMMMKDGKTLKDLLNDDDYNLVHNFIIDSMEMPAFISGMMEKVKPMFLSELVGMDMSSIKNGENPTGTKGTKSYEMVLAEMAKEREMNMLGLETAAYQMSVFDSIPYKDQAEMLVESIKSGGEAEGEQLDVLVELYKKQDINGLDEMLNQDEDIAKYNEVLLINRNKNWIPRIGEFAREKPTFFAVGAGHLPGREGVIILLREAGYTVRAVH